MFRRARLSLDAAVAAKFTPFQQVNYKGEKPKPMHDPRGPKPRAPTDEKGMENLRTLHHPSAPYDRDGDYAYTENEDGSVTYAPKAFNIIEPENLNEKGQLLPPRTPRDRSSEENLWRTGRNQPFWFEVPIREKHSFAWQKASEDFYFVETNIIWKAFDCPERIPIFMRDEVIRGNREIFNVEWLDRTLHWLQECRFMRCIGIYKPFLDKDTLRYHAWANKGVEVGRPVLSAAMEDAIKDLERAVKRKEAGLPPNYVWDKWGPMGNIDGSRSDTLPRFQLNPHIDPDGINVQRSDIQDFTTLEAMKERYAEFINADPTPYQGAFLAVSNGKFALDDFDPPLQELTVRLKFGVQSTQYDAILAAKKDDFEDEDAEREAQVKARAVVHATSLSQEEMRALVYLTADDDLLESITGLQYDEFELLAQENKPLPKKLNVETWDEFEALVRPIREECDEKVDALRMCYCIGRREDEIRAFIEEKCGLASFMDTNDKTLTACVIALFHDIKTLVEGKEWGKAACLALTDIERRDAVGDKAYAAYSVLQSLLLDKRRRIWATRFSGEAHEEKALDHMLENFNKRGDRMSTPGTVGAEFDREVEPIGRKVQRRVLDSDKSQISQTKIDKSSAAEKKKKGHVEVYKDLMKIHFAGGRLAGRA